MDKHVRKIDDGKFNIGRELTRNEVSHHAYNYMCSCTRCSVISSMKDGEQKQYYINQVQ